MPSPSASSSSSSRKKPKNTGQKDSLEHQILTSPSSYGTSHGQNYFDNGQVTYDSSIAPSPFYQQQAYYGRPSAPHQSDFYTVPNSQQSSGWDDSTFLGTGSSMPPAPSGQYSGP